MQVLLHAAFELCILRKLVLLLVLLVYVVAEVVFFLFFCFDVGGIAEGGEVIVGVVQSVIVEDEIPP